MANVIQSLCHMKLQVLRKAACLRKWGALHSSHLFSPPYFVPFPLPVFTCFGLVYWPLSWPTWESVLLVKRWYMQRNSTRDRSSLLYTKTSSPMLFGAKISSSEEQSSATQKTNKMTRHFNGTREEADAHNGGVFPKGWCGQINMFCARLWGHSFPTVA